MNALENWFCGSGLWRWITRCQLLPWLIADSNLGDHLLEVGAGFGAATSALHERVPRVTSLEYEFRSLAKLQSQTKYAGNTALNAGLVQADAAALPFPDATFTSAIAILMLHHLPSCEQQDRAFAEVHRVLRPGGVFLALEIPEGWLNRVAHVRSTFLPVAPASAPARLATAGFWRSSVDFRSSAFRIRAFRAWRDPNPVASPTVAPRTRPS